MTTPQGMLELADKIENADFLLIRDCPMVTKFDHENVDTYLSGEEHNRVVTALRQAAAPHAAIARQAQEPGEDKKLGSSETLGPHYDGTMMNKQQLHGTTRRNQPVVTAGETATPPP